MSEYGEMEISSIDRIRDLYRRRATYHKFYTDREWGKARNYHISLDSGKIGIDKCAVLIASLF